MTWTREFLKNEASPEPHDHDIPGAELAPGVVVERRSILWLPAAMAVTVLLSNRSSVSGSFEPPKSSGNSDSNVQIGWDLFVKECQAVAGEPGEGQIPTGPGHLLCNGSPRLPFDSRRRPDTKLFPYGRLDPKVEFAPSYRSVPFVVIQWRMHPGAILPAHCHPGASVCTLGLEGEARVRNFEIDGVAPAFDAGSKESFLMRETHSQLISPGRVNTLSTLRDNIHYFEAGRDGARGIDITTPYGGDGSFSFVAFEPERPKDVRRKLYEATWTGMKL